MARLIVNITMRATSEYIDTTSINRMPTIRVPKKPTPKNSRQSLSWFWISSLSGSICSLISSTILSRTPSSILRLKKGVSRCT